MDLSKMLDELYQEDDGRHGAKGDPSPETAGPEWSDEARLEEVFSTWTPGPPSDAPETEREMATMGVGADSDLRAELAGDDLLSAVEAESLGEVTARPWSRSDDDVLVGGRRGRLSLRRR